MRGCHFALSRSRPLIVGRVGEVGFIEQIFDVQLDVEPIARFEVEVIASDAR